MNDLTKTDELEKPATVAGQTEFALLGFDPLPGIEGGSGACGCCGYQYERLPMQAVIAVGFGNAECWKGEECIWSECGQDFEECMTVEQAEELAAADPSHDWRIHLVAPLSERHYQRQGERLWVLYEKGEGFA